MMTKHRALALLLITCTIGATASQAATQPSSTEFRQALYEVLSVIEAATGMEPAASQAVARSSDEDLQLIYDSWPNKTRMVTSARALADRAAAARIALSVETPSPGLPVAAPGTAAAAYPPNYPEGAPYVALLLLGMVDSPDDRCEGDLFDFYASFLAGAEVTLYVAERVCSAAGCDPTGIACIILCGATETTKLAVQTARVPLDQCARHEGGVDSAEIEAGYENGVSILSEVSGLDLGFDTLGADLTVHDRNIDGDLRSHDLNVTYDLAVHDGKLSSHQASLNAHDASLGAHDSNLGGHDTEVQALLSQLQFDLANAVELRRIHLQVTTVHQKKEYLVTATVGGLAADIELIGSKVYDSKTGAFIDIMPKTSVLAVEPGAYLVSFAKPKPDKIFKLEFKQSGPVDLFGEIVFGKDVDDDSD